jgi:hypothetical protein
MSEGLPQALALPGCQHRLIRRSRTAFGLVATEVPVEQRSLPKGAEGPLIYDHKEMRNIMINHETLEHPIFRQTQI